MRLLVILWSFLIGPFAFAVIPQTFLSCLGESGIEETTHMLVVDIKSQSLTVYKNDLLWKVYKVSTAKNGVGQRFDSGQTPLGLHRVFQKFGRGAPANTIFVARKNTGQIWNPKQGKDRDFILTRIFWLEGLEDGFNRGTDFSGHCVDSRLRFIYIHGTNQEERLGYPASRGCIRMEQRDLVHMFDEVPVASLVWIQ